MITRTELQELSGIDAGDEFLVTAQLSLSPDRQIERDYQVVFNDLVRQVEAESTEVEGRALRREAARIRQFLSSMTPRSLGLVIYACEPLDLWRVYELPVAVRDAVSLSRRASLRPLLEFMDEHEQHVIVLVDSEQARILVIDQLDIIDFWSVIDPVPGRHKQGGWSQANFQRSRDDAIDEHLRSVCTELMSIDARVSVPRIVVGGPQEPLSRLMQLLPENLRDRVIGRVSSEMFQNDAELVRASLEVVRDAERREEQRTVEDLLNTAAAGGRAARGPDAVLVEMFNGAVHDLVIADGMHLEGGVCPVCDCLTTASAGACPMCEAPVEPLPDVVEEAIRRTVAAGGNVEFVCDAAATDLVEKAGGIAARLRFATAQTSLT